MDHDDLQEHLDWARRMLAEAEARGDGEDVLVELRGLVADDEERIEAERQRSAARRN